MNNKATAWIFYTKNDEDFGTILATKLKADFPNTVIKTTTDLGDAPPFVPDIGQSNIVLLVFSGSKPGDWFAANVADALLAILEKNRRQAAIEPIVAWIKKKLGEHC